MTTVFLDEALSATFSWLHISAGPIFADAFDASGTLLASASSVGQMYGTSTFADVGPIMRVTFRDGNGQIGVGRIEFDTVPDPATLALFSLWTVGLMGYGWRRRKGTA